MEEESEKVNGIETFEREEINSKAIRAGKRTYFLDVKATKRNDYYLTITESKKRFNKDGKFFYEKHKIFLYKEDFEKFVEGLNEMIDFIKTANPTIIPTAVEEEEDVTNDFAAVDFEDLEKIN
jgi:hypothetical protein